MNEHRDERLQIMLTPDELSALDDWRFKHRMPSRAAAVRELLRRGLIAEGVRPAHAHRRSKDFGITDHESRQSDGGGRSDGAHKPRHSNGDDSDAR